jgi:hypothetical protein
MNQIFGVNFVMLLLLVESEALRQMKQGFCILHPFKDEE